MSFSPRKPESRSWTAFPEELSEKIKEVFTQTYLKEKTGKSFVIEGRLYESEILLRVGLLTMGRIAQDNFEASIDFKTPDDNVHARIHLCVDAIGQCFDSYFEDQITDSEDRDDDEDLLGYSRNWEEIDLDGDLLYLRYSSVNSLLEREADRMLGTLDENLFKEVPETEDALQRAEVDTDTAKARQKEIRSSDHLH